MSKYGEKKGKVSGGIDPFCDTYKPGRTKTSDFSTSKLVDEDGQFFGLSVSPGTASSLNLLSQTAIPWIRRNLQDYGAPMAREFGEKYLEMNPGRAMTFGRQAANAIGFATIFGKQIAEVGTNVYDTTRALNEMHKAAAPVMALNGHTLPGQALFSSGGNEIIGSSRSKINAVFLERLKDTAVGAVAALPQIWIWNKEEAARRAGRLKAEELQKAMDAGPEEVARIMEKELGMEGRIAGAVGETNVLNKMLESQEKMYLENFAAYKKENEARIRAEITKEVLGKEEWKVENRKKFGMDYYDKLAEKQNSNPMSAWTGNSGSNIDPRKRKAYEKQKIQEITDKQVRHEFASKYGVLDESWRKDLYFGMDKETIAAQPKIGTIKQTLTERYNKLNEELIGVNNGDKSKKRSQEVDTIVEVAAGAVGALIGEAATGLFGGKRMEKFRHPMALDRILHLRRVMEKAPGNEPPDLVPGIKDGKTTESDTSYAKYIHRIFQQHQRDTDNAEISDRFYTKLDEVKWDDKKIIELHDDELNPYEFAIKQITKRIRSGEMDPIALINLAGDKKNKIVRTSGKAFGPEGTDGGEEGVKETILQFIEHNSCELRMGAHMEDEEVNAAISGFLFSKEDIAHAFTDKGLQGQERAFFFAILDAHIPDSAALSKITGLNGEQVDALREEVRGRYSQLMDAAVLELNDMIEDNPKAADELQLTTTEKKLISNLARRIERDGVEVVDAAERAEMRDLETVIANATMTMGHDVEGAEHGSETKGPNFWQRLVGRSEKKGKEDSVKEAAADKKEESARDRRDRGFDDDHDDERDEKRTSHADRVRSERDKGRDKDKEDEGRDRDKGDPFDRMESRFKSRFGEDKHKGGDKDKEDSMIDRLAARDRKESTKTDIDPRGIYR